MERFAEIVDARASLGRAPIRVSSSGSSAAWRSLRKRRLRRFPAIVSS
ncbi:MAG: hypothetical protein H0T20_09110 [Actinobacteria bacterium]|nr:hypothetical protein [Actinomycetota bacterium]